jgi:hypothetical protein
MSRHAVRDEMSFKPSVPTADLLVRRLKALGLYSPEQERLLKRTGLACPDCGEPVGVIEREEPGRFVLICPSGYRWTAEELGEGRSRRPMA